MMKGEKIFDHLANIIASEEVNIPGQSIMELCTNRRILIEEHKGLLEYGPEKVMVEVSFGKLCIVGSGLKVAKMTSQQIAVVGCIRAVHLFEGAYA
jgi:sporulation protein YqfC